MNSYVKKTVSAVLLIFTLFSALFLTSCNRKYDEKEVKEATEKLLKKAETLNTVYYGQGIGYIKGHNEDGNYYEANPMSLKKLGFETIQELKNLTNETFTVGYSNLLYDTVLSPLRDGDKIIRLARYYQKYDTVDLTREECIMVHSEFDGIFDDRMTYDYGSIEVLGSKKEKVYAKVSAEVWDENKNRQKIEIKIVLLEEAGGWRIDNPVFANYNKEKN